VLAWCDELAQARAAAAATAARAATAATAAPDTAAAAATAGDVALPAPPHRVCFEALTTAPRETLLALCASIGVH